jgi:hypothetical protein
VDRLFPHLPIVHAGCDGAAPVDCAAQSAEDRALVNSLAPGSLMSRLRSMLLTWLWRPGGRGHDARGFGARRRVRLIDDHMEGTR